MKTISRALLIIILVSIFGLGLYSCDKNDNNGTDSGNTPVGPNGGGPPVDNNWQHAMSFNDLAYGSDNQQTLDISLPTYLDMLQSKVYVCLFLGDSEGESSHFDEIIEELLDKSHLRFAAVKVNYRSDKTTLEMLEDIRTAIEFLKTNASKYKLETTKLGMMGYAVGGYLSILYSYKITSPIPVKLVLAQSAFTSLTNGAFYSFPYTTDPAKQTAMLESRLQLVSQLSGEEITLANYEDISDKSTTLYGKLEELSVESYFTLSGGPEQFHLYHGEHDDIYNLSIMSDFKSKAGESRVKLFIFDSGHDDLYDDETRLNEAVDKLGQAAEDIFIRN
ncbi:MAG: hypothetical protein LBF12_07530 [Christensenellaceae bacterium]|jgi:acetyl esterase/lipase|nr:hypothetical protein [Christensenellaceae bacterium]